ncbi:26S proteasome non-ATPase regulatory subunit [Batrachochytrium dendrobatidis]
MGGSQAVKNTKQTAEKSDVIASVKEPTLEEKLATENAAFLSDVRQAIMLVERGVSSESRFITRALRGTSSIRPRLTSELLLKAVQENLAQDHQVRKILVDALESTQKSAKADMDIDTPGAKLPAKTSVPESGIFLGLLVAVYFHDQKLYSRVLHLLVS